MTTQKENSTIELIKRLSQGRGVTGYTGENTIQQIVADEITPLVDHVERDKMGSVVGIKHGLQDHSADTTPRKVMLAAHLDEIGAMVSDVDQGFLRFTEVGGLDDRVLMGQEVIVHSQRDLPGIIGSIPPHLLPPGESATEMAHQKMLIDVGLPPSQVEKLVNVGDLVTFVNPVVELQNGLVSGKAMDNRASLAAMLVCLQELKQRHHQWDVYAVATAGEEVGGYIGAATQAYTIQPDVALVLDVTFADVDEYEAKVGGGPVLGVGPSNHPVLRQRLIDITKKLDWTYQNEVVISGRGTDVYAIEVSRAGVPSILISVPNRYMHAPVEVVAAKDVERVGRLVAHFIAELDEAFVESLIPSGG